MTANDRSPPAELPAALRACFAKAGVALTLAEVEADGDVPLVLANEPFYRLTGYGPEDVLGRNCRFLQGRDTAAEARAALHDFVHDSDRDGGRFPILNYRADGSPFMNFVFMNRLRDDRGGTRYILASQFDMSSAVRHLPFAENDVELGRNLSDIQAIGRGFGIAMIGSARILSDSITTMARLSLDD